MFKFKNKLVNYTRRFSRPTDADANPEKRYTEIDRLMTMLDCHNKPKEK